MLRDKNNIISIILIILLVVVATTKNVVFVYLLFLIGLLLLNNPLYILPVYIIASLNGNYFDLGGGVSISRVLSLYLMIGILMFEKKRIDRSTWKNFTYILILLLFNFVSTLFSISGALFSFLQFCTYAILIIILNFVDTNKVRELSKLLIVSAVIIVFSFLLSLDQIATMSADSSERLSTGENVNANGFAMMVAQLIAIILTGFFILKKSILSKGLLITSIAIGFFLIILSGSRSALIGILLSSFFVYIIIMVKNKLRFVITSIFIVIFGYFFWQYIVSLNLEILGRFTLESVKDSGGTGRLDMWKMAVPYVMENHLIMGVGFGEENTTILLDKMGFDFSGAHNLLVDLFLQMGLAGIIIYFIYFKRIFLLVKHQLANNIYVYMPLWLLLTAGFNGIGEVVFSEKLFWNIIGLTLLFVNNNPFGKVTKKQMDLLHE